MIKLLLIAVAIASELLLIAYFGGKVFKSRVVRRRIIIGTAVACLIGAVIFFGLIAFTMSGCLNC